MRNSWNEYFTFNKRERRGVFVLTFLNLSALVLLTYKPALFPRDRFPADQAERIGKKLPFLPPSSKGNSFSLIPKKRFLSQKKQKHKLELNSSDSLDLLMLRGIGPSFAKRILKYREKLGGFVSLVQLMEVYGMDTARYRSLCEQIIVDPSRVKTLAINTLSKDSIRLHPYFRWNLANLIVSYREKHGPYKQIEDLRRLDLVNDSVYAKIAPYCRVQ